MCLSSFWRHDTGGAIYGEHGDGASRGVVRAYGRSYLPSWNQCQHGDPCAGQRATPSRGSASGSGPVYA